MGLDGIINEDLEPGIIQRIKPNLLARPGLNIVDYEGNILKTFPPGANPTPEEVATEIKNSGVACFRIHVPPTDIVAPMKGYI